MLTSYPNLDSTFSNPVAARPSPPRPDSHDNNSQQCFQLPAEPRWGGAPAISAKDFRCWSASAKRSKQPGAKPPKAMQGVEPEDDLKCLIDNELKLRLCGYYYGNLSWAAAAHTLKKCRVGTFLVRDSEHGSYLYALSVQTRKGPTSCRIEYSNGRFRLDSSEELSKKMPRFERVTDLVDHYVHLTKNLPRKNATAELSPVWLDMDEENTRDIPVQIFTPLYKGVQSLQHICRVTMVRMQRERHPNCSLSRTIDDHEYKVLPTVLKDYLKEYPYSQ